MKLFISFFIVLGLAACGPIRDMQLMTKTTGDMRVDTAEMRKQTAELNKGMQVTNAAVHLQVLTVALQQLTAPVNTKQLAPPALMMPPAHVFTEEATPTEIIKTFHSFWNDVIHGHTTDVDETKATAEDFRVKDRNVSLTAAKALAAFTPQAKFDEIVKVHITENGEYRESALALAASRYTFTEEWLFDATIKKNTRPELLTLKRLQSALVYFEAMKQIAKSPYVNELNFKLPKITLDPSATPPTVQDVTLEVTSNKFDLTARSAVRFIETLPAGFVNLPAVQSELAKMR